MISTDDDVENFVNLFRPLAGQQAVEAFRLGSADVLQDMGEPLPGILPKRLARTEKVYIMAAQRQESSFRQYR